MISQFGHNISFRMWTLLLPMFFTSTLMAKSKIWIYLVVVWNTITLCIWASLFKWWLTIITLTITPMTSLVIVHHESLVHSASELGLFLLFFIQQSIDQSFSSWQYNLSKNLHNQIFITWGKSIQHEIDNHFVWNWFANNYQ